MSYAKAMRVCALPACPNVFEAPGPRKRFCCRGCQNQERNHRLRMKRQADRDESAPLPMRLAHLRACKEKGVRPGLNGNNIQLTRSSMSGSIVTVMTL